MKKPKYIIGIDEAGRGPLAGPVAVGVSLIPANFNWKLIPGVGDSKKLSAKNREAIFSRVTQLKKENLIDYAVVMVGAKTIDKIGIVPAIKQALEKGLTKLCKAYNISPLELSIKLDGGLKAPAIYVQQETIIKGDDKELSIGLASIMAKVTRDKYMEKIAQRAEFSGYNFDIHKGYGTKKHREAISRLGISSEHRASFCRNIYPVRS
jgi:ribonuclease HII